MLIILIIGTNPDHWDQLNNYKEQSSIWRFNYEKEGGAGGDEAHRKNQTDHFRAIKKPPEKKLFDVMSSFCLALWARSTKNRDWSTGPLVRQFAHSLARSLRSLPRSWDSEWLDGYLFCVFFSPFWTIRSSRSDNTKRPRREKMRRIYGAGRDLRD